MGFGKLDVANLAIKAAGISGLASAAAKAAQSPNFPPFARDALAKLTPRQQPHRLIGGISLEEAKKLHKRFNSVGALAHKNLFEIRIVPRKERPAEEAEDQGDVVDGQDVKLATVKVAAEQASVMLYALEVSYAPITISGEKRRIGALSADSVQSRDPVEMRVTTYDNKKGDIKKWFRRMADAAVLTKDGELGLVGLPVDYLFDVIVTHAYFDTEIVKRENRKPYRDEFVMRVGQIDVDLSRRDEGISELQMTFVQYDQFMP